MHNLTSSAFGWSESISTVFRHMDVCYCIITYGVGLFMPPQFAFYTFCVVFILAIIVCSAIMWIHEFWQCKCLRTAAKICTKTLSIIVLVEFGWLFLAILKWDLMQLDCRTWQGTYLSGLISSPCPSNWSFPLVLHTVAIMVLYTIQIAYAVTLCLVEILKRQPHIHLTA